MCCLNEDLCELIFRKTLLLEGELLNLLKKTPKIAPPPEKKGKKKKIQNTSNVV